MLYVTTRSDPDAYTARRALLESRGPDGGLYVPFRTPGFTPEEIDALAQKRFNSCVAEVLNRMFGSRLTAWDVDLCIGRHPVRLSRLNNRVLVGESWHNLDHHFSRMVTNLTGMICVDANPVPGKWAETGVRIAVLFGIFRELMREGITSREQKVDILVVSGDFSAPLSAWYAREWGLPIGNIICCCNENGNLWDFICHGQLRTDGVAVKTVVPEGDVVVPDGLECLIHAYGGAQEVMNYLEVLRRGGTYYIEDKLLHVLRQGLYVTVASDRRILNTIPKVYGSQRYLLSPCSALAFAGLQDYRSRTGESRCCVVLAEQSPDCDLKTVAEALGISREKLEKHLEQN